MTKTCTTCSQSFEITDEDLAFYRKMDVPPPTLCPDCRLQRRLAFRNFRNLYDRKCDFSGRQIISMYAPTAPDGKPTPYTVYDQDIWWSDQWDPKSYGMEVDFNRSFFDQLGELLQKVPKFSVHNVLAENCQYSNLVFGSRNCYLVFGCIQSEDCYYGHIVWESQNCVDCLYVLTCELCYECVDCLKCYNLKFSRDCENCRDSAFLLDCKNCSDCFGCVGLRNQQYYIFNQPYTKEEYMKKMQQFDFCQPEQVRKVQEVVRELSAQQPFLYMHGSNAENCSGDYIYSSRNVHSSFDVKRSEDLKFAYTVKEFKDAYDVNFSGNPTELVYDSLTVGGRNIRFSHLCLNECHNVTYGDGCFGCKDCFGCSGLKKAQYCILNKQYTKQEYEDLVPRIVEHMKKTGEWGEFFPIRLSSFSYNETIAQEYFSLTGAQASQLGATWRPEKEERAKYYGSDIVIPDNIEDVQDSICDKVLSCEISGKYYKIIPQELRFYRQMKLPIPKKCPDERHQARMQLRNPRKLWDRTCMQCRTAIQTTYAPDRPETIYCEKCYLARMS